MKTIVLQGPTVINGAVRYPVEGHQIVDDAQADRLIDAGMAKEESEFDEDQEDGLDEMTVADLGLLVTKEGVPLNGATKKDDIILAIRAHRAKA